MIKKLISISLIAAAALVIEAIPSAQGGRYLSYNTPWTITCSAGPSAILPLAVNGQLNLTARSSLGNFSAGCTSVNGTTLTDTLNNATAHTPGSTAPTNWTWTSSGCFNIRLGPITGKVGQSIPYNCFSNPNGTGGLVASGSVMVGIPAGSTLP